MAKKEKSSLDSVAIFKDAMRRASLTDFFHVNGVMLSKNPNDVTILVIPERTLWDELVKDEELKDHIKELDITNQEQAKQSSLTQYANDLTSDQWLELDAEVLYGGKIINISIKGFTYDIPINKGLIPVKLKKAEYNHIAYRVFTSPSNLLGIKKMFEGAVSDTNFTVIRMFQII